MEKTNSKSSFRLVPLLDSFLRWVQKHFRLNGDVDVAKWYRITLSDALVCSALSQRFQEVLLTKLNRDRMRILKTSKSFRADFELRELMREIPELSQFELSSGDPGLFLLRQRMIAPGETGKPGEEAYLMFESIEEVDEFFLTTIQYTFYSKRKKKFVDEFAVADQQMQQMTTKYKLPGRFGFNAFVDPTDRHRAEKPNLDFMDDYGTPTAPAGEDDNKGVDEKEEVLGSNEQDILEGEDEEDEDDIEDDFDVGPDDLIPADE
ncbi:MAG: hypothetical protein JST69_09990 [Bacteroidetes bacterium]|nr:hypothetical protein [Bacteroidota bacterium]